MGWVELDCYKEDGKVLDSRGREVFSDFYVLHDGILRFERSVYRRYRYRPVLRQDRVRIGNHTYYNIKGIWYEVVLVPLSFEDRGVSRGRLASLYADVVLGRTYVTANELFRVHGKHVRAISKKQVASGIVRKIEQELARLEKVKPCSTNHFQYSMEWGR